MLDNQEEKKEAPNADNPQDWSQSQKNDDLAAAHERLKQQYAGSTQEAIAYKARYDKALDVAVEKVSQDNAYLLELSEKDPDLAKDVAKKWWNLTLEKALDQIKLAPASKKDENPLDEETQYKKFAERLKRELANEGVHKEASEFFTHLTGEVRTTAEWLYKKLTEWRDLAPIEAREFAEMATLYAQKEQIVSGKADLNIAMFGSTASLGRWSSQPAPDDKNSGKELAESLWLWHLYSKK